MENAKLGTLEAISLVSIVIINHVILNLPKQIIVNVGPAAILNVIYVSVLLFIIRYIIIKLLKPFSNTDIFGISKFLGGNFLRSMILIIYILALILVSSSVVRDFSDGIKLIFLPNTKTSIVLFTIILAACIANLNGFKAVCKANLIIFPIIFISIITVFVFSLSGFDFYRIFPILGYGAKEIFIDGALNIASFGGIIFLYILYPMLKEKKDFKKITSVSMAISTLCLFLGVVCLLLLFSFMFETENIFSIYLATRTIEIGRFVQRIDALFMLLWMLSIFSYLSVIISFILFCLKRLLNIKDSKKMCYSISLIIFGVALIPKNIAEVRYVDGNIAKYVVLAVCFIISIGVLAFANLKYKRIKRKGGTPVI